MKKIYIAQDYESKPLGVIIADNRDFAEVAFTSMKINHYSVEEIDLESNICKMNKVTYLLSSEEISFPDRPRLGQKYRRWKRGI